MSDHIRKYDDWEIVRSDKPLKPPLPPQGEESSGDSSQAPEPPVQNTVLEPGTPITNPFAQEETSPQADEAILNPFVDTAPATPELVVEDGTTPPPGSGENIDPDTGLPIPDYIKKFVDKN